MHQIAVNSSAPFSSYLHITVLPSSSRGRSVSRWTSTVWIRSCSTPASVPNVEGFRIKLISSFHQVKVFIPLSPRSPSPRLSPQLSLFPRLSLFTRHLHSGALSILFPTSSRHFWRHRIISGVITSFPASSRHLSRRHHVIPGVITSSFPAS